MSKKANTSAGKRRSRPRQYPRPKDGTRRKAPPVPLNPRQKVLRVGQVIGERGWSYATALFLAEDLGVSVSYTYELKRKWVKDMMSMRDAQDADWETSREMWLHQIKTVAAMAQDDGSYSAALKALEMVGEARGFIEKKVTPPAEDTGSQLAARFEAVEIEPVTAGAIEAPKSAVESIDAEFAEMEGEGNG